MAASTALAPGLHAAPVVQRYGNVTIQGTRWSGEEGADGLFHMVMRGGAVFTADSQPGTPANRHYELQAESIDYTIGGGKGAAMLSHAVALGNVRMTARSLVPARGTVPAGERVLVVTGARATFEGQGQTVDVTGSPVVQVSDPSLPQPAVLRDSTLVHVDILKRTFEASGEGEHRPTATLALPQNTVLPEPPAPSAPALTDHAPTAFRAAHSEDPI